MKFLCDNCQAKYQIGDEKVAGKTVRMKCRRCGHSIVVTAASGEAPATAESGAAAPAAPAAAAMPRPYEMDDESTSLMAAGPFPSAALAPPPPRPLGLAPPGAARPVPAPAARPAAPVGPPAARPMAPPAGPRPVAFVPPTPHVGAPQARATAVTAGTRATDGAPTAGGVAGAFARAVAAPPVAHAPPLAEHEWFVGVGGFPQGPMRVAAIREKIAARQVDGDSLVWREGLDEWRPLRSVVELADLLRPAPLKPAAAPLAPPRAAAVPPPPASAPRVVAAPARPAPPAAVVAPPVHAPVPAAAPLPPPPAAPAPTPAPVAPIVAPPIAAAPVAAAPHPLVAPPVAAAAPEQVVTVPPAAPMTPAAAPPPAAPANGAKPAPLVLADPFAAPAPAPSAKPNGIHAVAAPAALVPDDAPSKPVAPPSKAAVELDADIDKIVPPKRQTHPMAYAFIASAAVFSGVAAWVLLSKPTEKIIYVQQSASVVVAPSAAPTASQAQAGPEDLQTAPSSTAPRLQGRLPHTAGTGPAPTASVAGVPAPIDTSGFNSTVPGPTATQAPPPVAGGQLTSGEMSSVVSSNQPIVKRKCWQPALEGRSATGPTSAKVRVTMTVGPSGSVDSSSASGGEKDFPGLSSCVAARVRNWKFPPSGSSTPVEVPFVFAGQ